MEFQNISENHNNIIITKCAATQYYAMIIALDQQCLMLKTNLFSRPNVSWLVVKKHGNYPAREQHLVGGKMFSKSNTCLSDPLSVPSECVETCSG